MGRKGLVLSVKIGRRVRLADAETGETIAWLEAFGRNGGWVKLCIDADPRKVLIAREELLPEGERKYAS